MFEKWTENFYQTSEYPVLWRQRKRMEKEKPFNGLKILDATPIFRNTLLKYEALISGGADLIVGCSPLIPADSKILELLSHSGISVVELKNVSFVPDIVLDCGGIFSSLKPNFGSVELTRSGVEFYETANFPMFIADSSEIKKIETSLGTGESYFRAMEKFGYSSWKSKRLLVFGYGKVGSGIVHYALKYGAMVTVVADFKGEIPKDSKIQFIDISEFSKIREAILSAEFIVTATGKKNALAFAEIESALTNSKAVFANMGVEDEYGRSVLETRVLFNKKPLNFALEEPTLLKFMDATMAFHNALGEKLLQTKNLEKGINPLPGVLENEILELTRKYGNVLK